MPPLKNPKYITRNNKLKKVKPDSDSESDAEWTDTQESDDSESEEEETTDSSYKPSKKNKKIIQSDSSEDSSDSEEYKSSDSKEVNKASFQKMLANMFPSKYINEKVKASKKTSNKTSDKPLVSEKQLYDFMRKVKNDGTISESESEDESAESDESSDHETKYHVTKDHVTKKSKKSSTKKSSKKNTVKQTDDSESEDEVETNNQNHVNIIFSGYEEEYGDENDMNILEEDENTECTKEEEQTFMKEKYEVLEEPKLDTKPESKINKKSKDKPSEKKESVDTENEYGELIELKKHLMEKLQKKPESKILKRAIKDCTKSISKLVMKGRNTNAKKYYDMIHGEQKNTSELEYFKKKLSNKEQLKIMKEFDEINTYINIDKPYRLTLLQSNITPKYKATVMQKLNILRQMDPSDSEYYKIKNWVDTFMRVPFGKYKDLSVKMSDGIETCSKFMCDAKAKLDECVYGLNDAKLQILQLIGQWITNPSALGTAIAIKGPPGTGKSSLVKDGISQILGREFAFIALGGSGDSSFLEGHSYTYEGSSWGKIVQILIDSKCMNPIIYFDELDKISETPRGEEITGILTHLTDTTQNNQFHDKYFSEVDFDISKCLFIFSYNDESKVNPILRDRMYRIQTKGYLAKEKVIIARKHLLPKIREQVSFQESDVIIPDDTLMYIITNKTLTQDEAGVRNLKRCLEIIHTKLNLFRLVKSDNELFKAEIDLKVTFPMTVSCKDVDILIKNDENQNQSMLSMYI